MARRDRPPIQRCLRRGDEIVVQVIKEGIGTKGPTLSTYLSIPGKILVMMPGMVSKGVSRKIEDEVERRRLRQILDQLNPPEEIGFIIRTAGVGKSKAEIERDLKYLLRLWQTIEKKRDSSAGPLELYTEGDLVTRTVRDVFSADVDRIVIDNKDVANRVKEVIKLSSPRTRNRVELYDEPIPLFHKYGIEREIEQMYSRHVPLPSGGSLVIDSTEAIVAIDVNSGKFRDHSDAETTAFKTDMEAADEICRQLRLRDLGGVIICDFIDLRYERHRRELEHRLHENLKNDRAKTKVLRMSQFGIIEMTRQRMRPSLKRSVYFDCPHCKGAGLVKTPESMSLDVMRRLAIACTDQRVVRVELSVGPDVAFYLQNKKRQQIADIEDRSNKRIVIRPDQTLGLDEMRLDLFDNRDGAVIIEELSAALTSHPHTTQLGVRQPHQQRGGRPGDRRDDRGRQQRPPHPQPRHRGDLDDEEDVLEDRANVLEHESEEAGVPSPVVPQQQRQRDDQHRDRREFQQGGQRRPAPAQARDNGSPGGGGFGDEEQGGGHRRRRRRRGRRGRGRGRHQQGQPQQPEFAGEGAGDQAPSQPFDDSRLDEQRYPEVELESGAAEHYDRAAEDGFAPAAHEADRDDREDGDHLHRTEREPDPEVEPDADREPFHRPQPVEESAEREMPREEPEPVRADVREPAPPESAPAVEEPKTKPKRGGRRKSAKTPSAEKTRASGQQEEKPRSRKRGTRGGRKKKSEAQSADSEPAPQASAESAPATQAKAIAPLRRAGADKHLADDEPVLHEPVRRPRSYRDLDHIPDDFD